MDDFDNFLHEEARRFKILESQLDDLVRLAVRADAMIEECQAGSPVLDVLLAEAQHGFLTAVRVLTSGELDLFSEAGLAKVANAQNDVRRYREIITWIRGHVMRGGTARAEAEAVKDEMRMLSES